MKDSSPLSPRAATALADLQERLGHRFRDTGLLTRALTHPSLRQEQPGTENNQRLEFLGDAVLQLVVSDELYQHFPLEREGELTRRRAALTRGAFLAERARALQLQQAIGMAAAERARGGHERQAALEDAMEALVAAVYIDAGWEQARRVVLGWLGDWRAHLAETVPDSNPKGSLQEHIQPIHGNNALSYRTITMQGPPHERRFCVAVFLFDQELARGEGASKKDAEENAAAAALRGLTARSA